jgi:dTDP-4-dehydrorhamnose reductase
VRVAITGLSGLLGRYLVQADRAHHTIIGISREPQHDQAPQIDAWITTDLAEPGAGRTALAGIRPDAVIHAAGEGRVDVVEGHMDQFRGLNVDAAGEIAAYCREQSIPLVFLSSNAVFGGRQATPYADDSPLDPINDYGRLKAESEAAVLAADPTALVLRPLLMYGLPHATGRTNPALHWVGELGAGRQVRVVDDVRTQPLWARDCAEAIWRCIDRRLSGPMNISGGQSLTLFEFAQVTAEVFGFDPALVVPIASSSLTAIAPRPATTAFDLRRLHDDLGFTTVPPRQGLQALRRELIEHGLLSG